MISPILLDVSNTFISNQTSLKAVIGATATGRVFRAAKRLVLLCEHLTMEEKVSVAQLNSYVMLKTPSSCLYIPAPSLFASAGNVR